MNNYKYNRKSKIISCIFVGALILLMLTPIFGAKTLEKAEAVQPDECSSLNYRSNNSPVVDAKTVNYGGDKWDIIGYNNGVTKRGVSGPKNSVTLLLNRGSYNSIWERSFPIYDRSSIYSGSTFSAAMTYYANSLTTTRDIIARTLTSGNKSSDSEIGYNADNIVGNTVNGQKLWPLSMLEASQLKISERTYPKEWHLRTPTEPYYDDSAVTSFASISINGNAYSSYGYGGGVLRPALYLNISSPIFRFTNFSNSLKIGGCSITPKITDSNGYTWDIVGVNDGVNNKGVASPVDNAILLLSQTSSKKFGSISMGYESFNYPDSTFSSIMNSIYMQLKGNLAYKILERTLIGTSDSYSGVSDAGKVYGTSLSNQGVWPLSILEINQLDFSSYVYPQDWISRTSNVYYDHRYCGCHTTVGGDDYLYLAPRPALYVNLSSRIFQDNINSGKLNSNWRSEMGNSNIKISYFSKTLIVGAAKKFSAILTPIDSRNKSITWSSSNSKIITVNSKTGEVKAKSPGKVIIAVRSNADRSLVAKVAIVVKPKKFKVNSVENDKNKSKALIVKWTKQGRKKLTKVQLRYRVKGTSKWKTIAISPNAKSRKIEKLKLGKKYQFKIRGYKTVSREKYYSNWSAVKTSEKVEW
jgi:hypothetical protein